MCFSAPKVKKPPPPPNKLDTQADALANQQARRATGMTRSDTFTGAGNSALAGPPMPTIGGSRKTILGG